MPRLQGIRERRRTAFWDTQVFVWPKELAAALRVVAALLPDCGHTDCLEHPLLGAACDQNWTTR